MKKTMVFFAESGRSTNIAEEAVSARFKRRISICS